MVVTTLIILTCNSYKATSGKFTVCFLQYDYLPHCSVKLQSRLGDHIMPQNDSLRSSEIPDEILIFLAFCINELFFSFPFLKMIKTRHTILDNTVVTDRLAF